MDRAWSTLELKAVQDGGGKRTFTGIASTIKTDRMDDVVLPRGAQYKLPFPLLWQHNSQEPIGWVKAVRTTDKQIEVDCEVHNESQPGALKDLLDYAWQSIKAKLVAGLSIGFNPIKTARIEGSYGYEIQTWDWLELSPVTIAANGDCSITSIKSLDKTQLAASGHKQRAVTSPGASGTQQSASSGNPPNRSPKGNEMKTLQELRDLRNTKAARLQELVDLFKTDGHETSDDEAVEFDTLDAEVKGLDTEIRVARFNSTNAAGATPVAGKSAADASRSRGGDILVRKTDPEDSFPGQTFARIVKAKAVAFKHHMPMSAVAERMFGKTHPGLVQYLKSGVPGGGTGSGEWGAELVGIDNRYTGDFVTFLYGITGFDKLGLREAPRNVAVKGMDGAATGYWVGESKAIPVSAPSASSQDLVARKVGGMCVVSNELLADSSPGAEMLVRDALAEALALRVDTTFFSAAAAVSGVSPAGILNGLSQIATGGSDAAAVRTLINALYAGFISAKNAGGLKLVMSPGTAKALGLLVNALGQSEFPGLGVGGGTLLGDTVVTSDNIDPSQIILLKPSDIWRIGDMGVDIEISSEAMVEQDTAPTGASDTPAASSATMVSMFGTDSSAIRAIRRVGWAPRRTGVVAFTDTADFGGVAS